MAEYKKKDFTGQNVAMDGNKYEDCNFTGSSLTFNGAAANTVVLLQALAKDPVLIGVVHGFLPQFKPKS
ncbi:hypothetical protein [Terricaulis silvestris]|uniref:Uncharacterized protein n=1 Tax=Terricaulis silvestris TaxID=2686094 RepID=A0A6I6MNC9_9CAUL|nr:hypothetical protein [Terricaulis silvestris]QGZ97035.1 hypothetical protein DSM104635_03900 [Terricaulis silvestris]